MKRHILKNKTILPNIYLILILLFIYLPIFFVVLYSFNESKTTASWTGFSLKWYQSLLNNRDMFDALKNSLILGVLSCFCAAVIGTLAAIGTSRIHYKSKGMMEYVSLLPIMIPEIILGMVFMAFFSFLKLPFGMLTLIIAHTTFCLPYIYMLVKARLVGIDKSIEEAARDLGASPFRTFLDITFPLIMPAIASGSLLAFAMSFDDVVISIFVTGARTSTLPIRVYSQVKFGVTPEINALCTIMLAIIFTTLGLFSFVKKLRKH